MGPVGDFLDLSSGEIKLLFLNIFMCDPHSTMNLYFQRLLGDISGLLQRKKQEAGQQNSQKLIGSLGYYPYHPCMVYPTFTIKTNQM